MKALDGNIAVRQSSGHTAVRMSLMNVIHRAKARRVLERKRYSR